MTLPPFMKVQGDVVYLSLKVQPRASKNEIGEVVGNELKVKITAPPVDSAANDALVKFLAETLGCPRGAVQLVRGGASRHKIIAVRATIQAVITALRINQETKPNTRPDRSLGTA